MVSKNTIKKDGLKIMREVIDVRGLPEEAFSLWLNFSDISLATSVLKPNTGFTRLAGCMLLMKVVHETFTFTDKIIMKNLSLVKPSSLISKEWERLTSQNRWAIEFIKSLRNTASHYDSNEMRGKLKQIRKFDKNLSEKEYILKFTSIMIFDDDLKEPKLKEIFSELLIVISKMSDIYMNIYVPELIKIISLKTKENNITAETEKIKIAIKPFFSFLENIKNNFDAYWDINVKEFYRGFNEENNKGSSDDIG